MKKFTKGGSNFPLKYPWDFLGSKYYSHNPPRMTNTSPPLNGNPGNYENPGKMASLVEMKYTLLAVRDLVSTPASIDLDPKSFGIVGCFCVFPS